MNPAHREAIISEVRGVMQAHADLGNPRLNYQVHFSYEGVAVALCHNPEPGGIPRTLERFYGNRRMTEEQFLEYVHCGVHGLLAQAMTQWDLF